MYGPGFIGFATVNEPTEADQHPEWSAAYAWDCAMAMSLTERERQRCKEGRQRALRAYAERER